MRRVVNRRFELSGNSHFRLLKLSLIGKFVPVGNLRGGPGVRCLAVLSLLHYCGYPLYYVRARYGHRLQVFKKILDKIRH